MPMRDRPRTRGRQVPRRGPPVAGGQPSRGLRRRRRTGADDAARRRHPRSGRTSWHEAGYVCVSVAEGVRRPGSRRRRDRGHERGVRPGRRAPRHPGHGRVARRPVDHRARHRRAEGVLPARASSTAPTATARASPSPTPAPTWPACRPAASSTATRSSSPARRCGPPARTVANMMFCLCRTDPDAPKHQGISYVLTPMKRRRRLVERLRAAADPPAHRHRRLHRDVHHRGPGSAVQRDRRPAQRLAGDDDDARQRAGRQRHDPARAVHERSSGRSSRRCAQLGRTDDPLVRQQLAWAYTHVEIMRYQGLRTLSEVVARRSPGPAVVDQQDVLVGVRPATSARSMINLRGADAHDAAPTARGTGSDRWQTRLPRQPLGHDLGWHRRRCSATSSASGCSACPRNPATTRSRSATVGTD